METSEILIIIFTAVIAGATIWYAITTRGLWQVTNKNVEETSKFFRLNFLALIREIAPVSKDIVNRVILHHFQKDYEKVLKTITEQRPIRRIEEQLGQLESMVRLEEVRKYIANGNFSEAERVYEKLLLTRSLNSQEIEDYIHILLRSKEKEKIDKTWSLLQGNRDILSTDTFLKLHIRIAYSYYPAYHYCPPPEIIGKAIEICEEGLSIAEENKQIPEVAAEIPRFKNSLAYYYADAGKPEFEALARQLSKETADERPGEADPLDTLGYVKIVYGKTEEEIMEGVSLCEEARRGGTLWDFYIKHIKKAEERLREIRRIIHSST